MDQQLVPADLGYKSAEEGGIFVHLERLGKWRWRWWDSDDHDPVANDDAGAGRIVHFSMGSVWWVGLGWVGVLCALYVQCAQSVLFAVSVRLIMDGLFGGLFRGWLDEKVVG